MLVAGISIGKLVADGRGGSPSQSWRQDMEDHADDAAGSRRRIMAAVLDWLLDDRWKVASRGLGGRG